MTKEYIPMFMSRKQMIKFNSSEKFEHIVWKASSKEGLCIFELEEKWRVLSWWNQERITHSLDAIQLNPSTPPSKIPFEGGWVGWMEYPQPEKPAKLLFWECDGAICLNLQEQVYYITGTKDFCSQARYLFSRKALSIPDRVSARVPRATEHDRSLFCDGIVALKEAIKDGKVYQANLSWKSAPFKLDTPLAHYFNLQNNNKARFGCFLQFQRNYIISNSPELFLKSWTIENQTFVMSQPIKGTSNRTLEEKRRLWVNPKEHAELTMITDLMRNDLGRLAAKGSVFTSHRSLRRCGDLLHAQQSIFTKLKPEYTIIDTLKTAFPAGSISGAPKLSAMQYIFELENHHRGIYTGSLGFLSSSGRSHFNVAIRTLHVQEDMCSLCVGCGIVFDSIPQKEWEESKAKGRAISHLLFT